MILLPILGIILSLAATVFVFIFIFPESKRASLPPIGQFVHDLIHFKFLIIEKVLKFLYTFLTAFCFIGGFLMLFWFTKSYSWFGSAPKLVWRGWIGLVLMILGPIAVRLVYEASMMFILLITNVIQINNKLKGDGSDAPAPSYTQQPYTQNTSSAQSADPFAQSSDPFAPTQSNQNNNNNAFPL